MAMQVYPPLMVKYLFCSLTILPLEEFTCHFLLNYVSTTPSLVVSWGKIYFEILLSHLTSRAKQKALLDNVKLGGLVSNYIAR